VHIILRDTDAGHIDAETTVTEWDPKSNAVALSSRINAFMAEIAQEIQPPMQKPDLMCDLGQLNLSAA